jgi:PAS domain S-box-containing protein
MAATGPGVHDRIGPHAIRPEPTPIGLGVVLESMRDAFCAIDRDWCFVAINGVMEQIWQLQREKVLGRSIREVLPQLAGSELEAALQAALTTGTSRQFEATDPVRGTAIELNVIAHHAGIAISVRDVAPIRETSLLRDSAEILALAEASAVIGVWDLDLDTGMLRGAEQFFRIMGLAPTNEPVPIETTRRLRHPADQERVLGAFRQALTTGSDYFEAEYRIFRPDGELRWIFCRGRVTRNASGMPVRLSGVDVDVTSRKLAEAALRESEQRFRRVFEQSPLGKAMAGLDFRFRAVNPALCHMLGYTEDELVGRSFLQFVHPDDRANCAAMGQALIDGTAPQIQLEERLVSKSGDAIWASVNVGPIRDADGNILYTLGINENIDERKRIAQALEDNELRLRALNEQLESQAEERATQLASSRAQLQAFFENSTDWLTLQRATADGRIVYADLNPASEAAYGMSRDQVIGRTVEDVLGVEAAQVPLYHLRECLRTGEPQRYVARRTMTGQTRTIDVTFVLVPAQTATGDQFIITAARDLTEREQLEAQLRQAQKMEAIGQLTGGVAHDFNNLLAVIGGNAELAKRRPAANLDRLMGNILRATERGVALTRQLLSFSRRHTGTPQVIDLRTELPRVAEMLRASLRGNIAMRMNVAEDLWPVEVDLAELEIALLNIAVNARDAMPQGGSFDIDVRNVSDGMVDADRVVLTLRDSGTGIPPDVISKVFDPFFTTKEPGEGTGLGLSQVYGFVHQSGGTVALQSELGSGTSITIRLPRSRKPLPSIQVPAGADRAVRENGRILVVEDNPQVAEVTAQMLTAMGFQVEVADRARKAIERIDAGEQFDLLMTDVIMPEGINGLELAKLVRARFPNLPIILTSGYNDVVPPAGAAFPVLRKPVPYEELHRAVSASLRAALPA